jgi:hypothetical protein
MLSPDRPAERVDDPLLPTGLHVGHLAVAHAACRAAGDAVELVHLGAARRKERLFRRAARHGAGAQVRHEGPCAEDSRMTWRHCVDIDDPSEAFGDRLDDGRGDRCGRRRPGLSGGQKQDRHARADAGFHREAAFGGELHGRYDESSWTATRTASRATPPLRPRPCGSAPCRGRRRKGRRRTCRRVSSCRQGRHRAC